MSTVCLVLSTLNSKVFVLAMETPHRHLLLPQSALDDLVATAGVVARTQQQRGGRGGSIRCSVQCTTRSVLASKQLDSVSSVVLKHAVT